MPITRRQFDLGIGQDSAEQLQRIAGFLKEHGDEAYSLRELAQMMGVAVPPDDLAVSYEQATNMEASAQAWRRFQWLLEVLVGWDVVRMRMVNALNYFASGPASLADIFGEGERMTDKKEP